MVRACITMTVAREQRAEAIAALRSIVGPTQAEPGCLQCSVYVDAEDACRLCIIEEWLTQAHLRNRLRSKAYLDLLEIMEMATVEPRVQFDEFTIRRGIEVIHEERESEP